MTDADEYVRVELSTPLLEAWFYLDGGVTIGEVCAGFMVNGWHIRPADARAMFAARRALPPAATSGKAPRP